MTRTALLLGLLGLLAPIRAQEAGDPAPEPEAEATAASAEPAGPAVLRLAPVATVSVDYITLADVTDVSPESELAVARIAPAPLPGHARTITRDQVALRLERAGYRAGEFVLGGADSVVVRRESRRLSTADVATALAALVPVPVTIERLPARRSLPLGDLSYRLRWALPHPLPERFNIGLDVLVDGALIDPLIVAVRRDLPAEPLPTQIGLGQLAGGGANGTGILQTATQPARQAGPGAVEAPVEAPPSWRVKRGDRIKVIAIVGRVQVTVIGVAREPGARGDVIQVETTISRQRRLVAARLLAPDRAALEM